MIPIPKPEDLRRRLTEWALMLLTGAVVYLFLEIQDLNRYVREKLNAAMITEQGVIMENTEALNNFKLKTESK